MTKRITGEFAKLQKNKEGWFTVGTYSDDIYQWKVIVNGPENSPYEGGKFEVKITLPKEYPHKPPTLVVMTKVYSPIVNPEDHTICHPILQTDNKPGNWAPTSSVYEVLVAFRSMLGSLSTDHVTNTEVAQVLAERPEEFKKTAREWTKLYAK
ncbi:ubiquitin-conjugating enzyme E2, putative [Entamoeba dispar SAW760]|uniref:Ubiquitin-conjugating enzyme E2, putative n=1 Tax=Entamoeba dispar (strain ATCC PRA-260 / SAW760) TaxID=370354 RepID=B0EIJ7_ENTDS|nr:ubiquitin-conjugating enzyme E2, putative [Entamoeba dispar SAW760]XP_001739280.1 ubiquitin-conjugating enzyme E2, putative [Entamoeba dispar SAW760]EDR24322.1 ubiquitin-conjugating enzyme E2, putative [Entamoeba dispar SAW760]EDR25650.1 ubiquitin-conjugating enzyme E2, putative [Entamoeba dispar SAW760]|eukprot:EDR24322.1 ubiquitin-conjugating enzyme E2, putative [Entamoeba dispar SAW760]